MVLKPIYIYYVCIYIDRYIIYTYIFIEIYTYFFKEKKKHRMVCILRKNYSASSP